MATVLTTPTDAEMDAVTPAQLAACASRELAMRKRVYPHWVDTGRMTREAAQREITAMAAIVRVLDKRAQGDLFA